MKTDNTTLGGRLRAARKARGMTQDELAEKSGMKQPDISKLERGEMAQTTGMARLARALHIRAEWLELGEGPEPMWAPVARESLNSYTVAHPVSLDPPSTGFPLLSWKSLMHLSLPDLFRTTLPDDALAPEFPLGTEVMWSRHRRAVGGRVVLVADSHGQVHARRHVQGAAPGEWTAAPDNPNYVSLHSTATGFKLLAVLKGKLEPDDE